MSTKEENIMTFNQFINENCNCYKLPPIVEVEKSSLQIHNDTQVDNFDSFVIRKFKIEDREQVMDLLIKAFSHLMSAEKIPAYTDFYTNYNKSIVVDKNGEIVGLYLLGDRSLSKGIKNERINKIYVNLEEYDKKIGLEGVALVVKKSERGNGLGSKLKDYVRTLGVDYVWGIQYKDLGNLQQWLRRRKLAAENNYLNITVEDLN